jgi:hypothetical protein
LGCFAGKASPVSSGPQTRSHRWRTIGHARNKSVKQAAGSLKGQGEYQRIVQALRTPFIQKLSEKGAKNFHTIRNDKKIIDHDIQLSGKKSIAIVRKNRHILIHQHAPHVLFGIYLQKPEFRVRFFSEIRTGSS